MNDIPAETTEPDLMDGTAMRDAILRKLTYDLGKSRGAALDRDWFMATALAVRDRVVDPWLSDMRSAYHTGQKQVYYLSLEFLIGRLLRDNISNFGLMEEVKAALASLDVDAHKVAAC